MVKEYELLSFVPSTVPASSHSATYSCTLTNQWSAATHPVLYSSISQNAHWSPPALVAHNEAYNLWTPNELASPGVENVAETGSTSKLEKEIQKAQKKKKAGDLVVGNGQFNRNDPPQTFESITLTPYFPLFSAITMAAPSPDWFTGFYDVAPVDDGETGVVWYKMFEIATFPWDGGTEQGSTYSINNAPEDPHVPIQQLTADTVPDNGILLNPDGDEVLPMAKWTCELVDSSCSNSDNLRFKNFKKRNCAWVAKRKRKRCAKVFRGIPLSSWCPETCGKCN